MGVTYYVIPVTEVERYPFAVDCLRAHGLAPLARSEAGRNPTPQELRAVLDALPGYATAYYVGPGNWQAEVQATSGPRLLRAHALLNALDFQGDETLPHAICFEAGTLWLSLAIVERVSRRCGPLYVFPDTGAPPLRVTPGLDPAQAARGWETG